MCFVMLNTLNTVGRAGPVVESQVEASVHGENIVPRPSTSVAIEAPVVGFHPTRIVEVVEVVCPLKVETLGAPVISPYFDVIVLNYDGELAGIQTVSPRAPGGRPQVHEEVLLFVHAPNTFLVTPSGINSLAIYNPGNAVRGPFNGIGAPVIKAAIREVQTSLILSL